MRWNTKESEEGGEETKMMMVNRGEWEELVKIIERCEGGDKGVEKRFEGDERLLGEDKEMDKGESEGGEGE